MKVNQVVQSLEQLQQELERLAPAVDHVEAARKVTEALSSIPGQHQELVTQLLATYESRIAELNGVVETFGSEAKSALDKVRQANEKSLEDYQGAARSSIDKQKAEMTAYQEKAQEVQATFYRDLSLGLEKLQNTINEESGKAYQAIQEENKIATQLHQSIEEYHGKIHAIDFPTRLDKLDATVSGIMAATQTTQGRVDNLESRTSEKLAALSTSIGKLESTTSEKLAALSTSVENEQKALAASIEKANKSTRTLLIVSIVLSVLTLVAVAYLFTRT